MSRRIVLNAVPIEVETVPLLACRHLQVWHRPKGLVKGALSFSQLPVGSLAAVCRQVVIKCRADDLGECASVACSQFLDLLALLFG